MSGAVLREAAGFQEAAGEWIAGTAFLAVALAAVLLAGCTKREKVLDVETPGGSVEVYKEKPVTE